MFLTVGRTAQVADSGRFCDREYTVLLYWAPQLSLGVQACYARCSDTESASSHGMASVFRIRKATGANSGATVSRCFGLYSSGLTPYYLVDRSVSDVLSEEHLLVEVRRRNLPHPISKYGTQSLLDLGPVMFDVTQLVPRPCWLLIATNTFC